MKKHLAIFSKDVVGQIFKGKKVIESRFSEKRVLPFGQVEIGDLIYIKPPGEDIVGSFKAKKVISIEGLEENDWQMIKKNFGKGLSLGSALSDEVFFKDHSKAQFATIIYIGDVEQFITSPVRITKRDRRSWMIL